MKKIMYKIAGAGLLCLLLALKGFAQDTAPVPPPPPPEPSVDSDSGGEQSEIIIRQKVDKDAKVTIEIRNGDFFVNGKPLEKFDDQDLDIEKREFREEGPRFGGTRSPFRRDGWDRELFERDLRRSMDDANRSMDDANRSMREPGEHRENEAFLGVSSRRAETGGATVLEVTKGSPAEKAGLKKADIILGVNDVSIQTPDNLFEVIHACKPGEKVKIKYKRDGKEQTVSAVLDKSKGVERSYRFQYKTPQVYGFQGPDLPGLPGLESEIWGPMPPKLGIKAQDSEEGKGVNVLDVTGGSAAEKAGLKKGDIITQFDGTEVNSANDLIRELRANREKFLVKVKILRAGKAQELDIRIPHKLNTAEL